MNKKVTKAKVLQLTPMFPILGHCIAIPGGTDLEREYGDMRPWGPPFHSSPVVPKGPISSKRVSSQDPLLRKFGNFSFYSLNFHPNFSSQAPKFGNFQLTSPGFGNFQFTSPRIWKFSVYKPLFRGKYQFASATLQKSGPHMHPYLKKSWTPPPPPGLQLSHGSVATDPWYGACCNTWHSVLKHLLHVCWTSKQMKIKLTDDPFRWNQLLVPSWVSMIN